MARRVACSFLVCAALASSPAAQSHEVNAPVAPDTIYVGRLGLQPGLSVIDLSGFGAGTGNPQFDPLCPIVEGNTNYPNNPNVALQGALLVPPLAPGTTTSDGGSEGIFRLTRAADLDDRLVGSPTIQSVRDLALGRPLDLVFNNGLPFGCTAGGGNPCAMSGLQVFEPVLSGPNTLAPFAGVGALLQLTIVGGNPISWAPHPNPPALVDPPLCLSPAIDGQEPTSVDNVLVNLLAPGAFLGNPSICLPPTGLLTLEQNTFFQGPSPPGPIIIGCNTFAMRQQVGHFLYVADPVAKEVVVLNSNRFTVLDRIPTPDPNRLAMSTNLNFLAVTNTRQNNVSIIDVDPSSATFHQVVKTVPVGEKPFGIAWDPGNEDVFVCNTGDGTVSIISVFTLTVRKTLTNGLDDPFEVVITPRQDAFGLQRNVYFAWILNRSGRVSLFESGPDGISGWGYDDVIGQTSFVLAKPKAIQPDHHELASGVWIAHEGQVDGQGNPTGLPGGALTNLFLTGNQGIQPLDTAPPDPRLRDLAFNVRVSVGSDVLTGIPTDIAFDNQRNFGALTNYHTSFSVGIPVAMNGRNLVRRVGAVVENANEPALMFVAIPRSSEGRSVVDVLDLGAGGNVRFDTNPFQVGVQSIPAPGAAIVMDYFRQ